MRHVIQMTQDELAELIIMKLTEDGRSFEAGFTLEFVRSANGQISALIQGVVQEAPEKKPPKKKAAPEQQAARDVLGGSGSAMGRGEALGQIVPRKRRSRR